MKPEQIMELALNQTEISILSGLYGGPFGAIIVKDGKIVGKGINQVTGTNDPTAHAEIVAIRDACKNLNTFDLTGCELYATGYPCPMCMSAIIWANIKKVYFAGNYEDAEKIGFRDDFIFNFIVNKYQDSEILELIQLSESRKKAQELYKKFTELNGIMY